MQSCISLLEGEAISAEELRASLRKVHHRSEVISRSWLAPHSRTKGYNPCSMRWSTTCLRPLDAGEVHGTNPDNGEAITRQPADSEPFSALAFKIMADPLSAS